jgi:hypothetical protein
MSGTQFPSQVPRVGPSGAQSSAQTTTTTPAQPGPRVQVNSAPQMLQRTSVSRPAPRQFSGPPTAPGQQIPAQPLQQALADYTQRRANFDGLETEFKQTQQRLNSLVGAGAMTQQVADHLTKEMKKGLENLTQALTYTYKSLDHANRAQGDKNAKEIVDGCVAYMNKVKAASDQNTDILRQKLVSTNQIVAASGSFIPAHIEIKKTHKKVLELNGSAESNRKSSNNPKGFLEGFQVDNSAEILRDSYQLMKDIEEGKELLGKGNFVEAQKIFNKAEISQKKIDADANSFKILEVRMEGKAKIEQNKSTLKSIEPKLTALVKSGAIEESVLTKIETAMRLTDNQLDKARDYYKGINGAEINHDNAKAQADLAILTASNTSKLLEGVQQHIKSIDEKSKKKRVSFSEEPQKVFLVPNGLNNESEKKNVLEGKPKKPITEENMLLKINRSVGKEGTGAAAAKGGIYSVKKEEGILGNSNTQFTDVLNHLESLKRAKNEERKKAGQEPDEKYDEELSKQATNEMGPRPEDSLTSKNTQKNSENTSFTGNKLPW